MHNKSKKFIEFIKEKMVDYFKNKNVMDIGAGDINGNNMYLFENCNYNANDVYQTENITVVSKTKDLQFDDEYFDTIISTECFQNDPEYEESLIKICKMLKPDGLFVFTCASTGRPETGTRKASPKDSYGTIIGDVLMQDYYCNLTIEDINNVVNIRNFFSDFICYYCKDNKDLYFAGIKKGNKEIKFENFNRKNLVDLKMNLDVKKNKEDSEIAVCFFGLTRSLKSTLNSIKNNIFDVLDENNMKYDTFITTYNLDYINNPRSKEYNVKLDNNEYKLLNPDFFMITDQHKFDVKIKASDYLTNGDPWGENHINNPSLKNFLRQLNSLQKCGDMFELYKKKYKCYIFIRPDLEYVNKLDINQVKFILDNYEKKYLLTPNFHRWGGLNDRYFIGTKETTYLLINRINNIYEYSLKKAPHSESFLKYIVDINNIDNYDLNLYACRVRSNGIKQLIDVNEMTKLGFM